jgi:hypothetical protein
MKSVQVTMAVCNVLTAAVIAGGSIMPRTSFAQSEASIAVSTLPIASVVIAGSGVSMASGAIAAIPAALAISGTYLIVKTVESTARGTIYVLERASDGASAVIEVVGRGVQAASLVVGSAVAVSVIGAGVILIAGGSAIAFIPNEIGRALLRNERLTF